MVLLGVILILLGALAIVAAVFTADETSTGLEYLGLDVQPLSLFLIGVAASLLIVLGLWLARFGAKRSLRQRKENKKIEDLSRKLDEADHDRNRDGEGHSERTTGPYN